MSRKKHRFRYLKYYKFRESVLLLFSLLIDSIYRRIPSHIFTVRNTYEALLLRNATISRENDEAVVSLNGFTYKLRITGSDFEVFNQIVLQEELETVIQHAHHLKNEQLNIIDCGANIGLSSLTFKKNFPQANIICVEPERSNYLQLCKNISMNNLTNVTAIEAGVWYKKATLVPDLEFRDKSNWSFALKEAKDKTTSGIKVDSILNIAAAAGWSHVDILKIDIEGSEFELFKNIETWQSILDSIKIISIEVHEEKGQLEEIEKILLQKGFHLKNSGELVIGIRN